MSGTRSTVIYGGGVMFLLLLLVIFLMGFPFGTSEAQAQSADPGNGAHSSTSLGDFLAAGGLSGWLIILLGLIAVVVTAIGAVGVRKADPWPHWRPLVRGLGEAAFLIGLAGTVLGMIMAMNEITRLGANVTPRDLSSGISHALVTVLFGTLVSLGTVVCAGVLRLLEPRPA